MARWPDGRASICQSVFIRKLSTLAGWFVYWPVCSLKREKKKAWSWVLGAWGGSGGGGGENYDQDIVSEKISIKKRNDSIFGRIVITSI